MDRGDAEEAQDGTDGDDDERHAHRAAAPRVPPPPAPSPISSRRSVQVVIRCGLGGVEGSSTRASHRRPSPVRTRRAARPGAGPSRRRARAVDDDPQGRPLGRRQLLVLERQQAGAGVVEPAQPGLEAGDVVLRPPLAELGAGVAQAGRRGRPSAGRGARRSWRPGTRPAPGGRGCPSRRSGPGPRAWANRTQIRLRSTPSSRSSGGYSRASASFQAANSQCGPST